MRYKWKMLLINKVRILENFYANQKLKLIKNVMNVTKNKMKNYKI